MSRSTPSPVAAVLLLALLSTSSCSSGPEVRYAEFEGYMAAAKAAWPLAMDEPFPATFTNADGDRLHAAIGRKTGLDPARFPHYRAFFDAASRELARRAAAEALAGRSEGELALLVPEADAVSVVRSYLSALVRESTRTRYWIGGEPPRAFDRLLDFQEPTRAVLGTAATAVGPIPCYRVDAVCRTADLRGRTAERVFTFVVTAYAARAALYDVEGGL